MKRSKCSVSFLSILPLKHPNALPASYRCLDLGLRRQVFHFPSSSLAWPSFSTGSSSAFYLHPKPVRQLLSSHKPPGRYCTTHAHIPPECLWRHLRALETEKIQLHPIKCARWNNVLGRFEELRIWPMTMTIKGTTSLCPSLRRCLTRGGSLVQMMCRCSWCTRTTLGKLFHWHRS